MAMTLVGQQAAPASNLFDFTGLDLSAYIRAQLFLDGLVVGTDGAFITAQLYIGGVLQTSGYRWRVRSLSSSTNTSEASSVSDSAVQINGGANSDWGVGNDAGEGFSGDLEIRAISASIYKQMMTRAVNVAPSGAVVRYWGGGILENTGTVNGIRIGVSTGTLTAGKATLYGLAAS